MPNILKRGGQNEWIKAFPIDGAILIGGKIRTHQVKYVQNRHKSPFSSVKDRMLTYDTAKLLLALINLCSLRFKPNSSFRMGCRYTNVEVHTYIVVWVLPCRRVVSLVAVVRVDLD